MSKITCLDCGHIFEGKYCNNCGQPANTNRFSLVYFFSHGIVYGIFNIEKGFFFSIKELFSRPGHSIREYIKGKRSKHVNYFTLLIIVSLISSMVRDYSSYHAADLVQRDKELLNLIENIHLRYPKLFIISIIPVHAIFTYVIFYRVRYNFSEHLVLNTYKSAATMIIQMVYVGIAIFVVDISVLVHINYFMAFLLFVYGFWYYYQFFMDFGYSWIGLTWRSLLCGLDMHIISIALVVIWEMTH